MLIKEEFKNTIDWIKPAIDAVILAAGGQLNDLFKGHF
jgi:hypothetical protein